MKWGRWEVGKGGRQRRIWGMGGRLRREIGREMREEGEILNREFMSGWEG